MDDLGDGARGAAARIAAEGGEDRSLPLRARRLPVVCLLIVSVVLSSATAVVLAADADSDPFRAGVSSHSHDSEATFATRAAKPRRTGRKLSSSKRSKCVVASRGRKRGKHHRKVHRLCVVKRSKRKGVKPSASGKGSGSGAVPSPSPFGPSLGGTGTPVSGAPPANPASPSEPAAPFRFFAQTSFWNEPVPADAPLEPGSTSIVDAFDEEIAKEEKTKSLPTVNTTAWSVPVYTVPADQPTVKVTLEDASRAPVLQSAWDAVPLPANAQPAAGTDKHLVVWQPSTDRLWEFWRLEHTGAGWWASWGGAMQKASSDSGAYGAEALPGADSNWGASASSLSIAGGLITLEDLERGEINHALAMAIPYPRAGVYASPAKRTDGLSTDPLSLPEGAHLRLEPDLDLASLHLPRLTLMMAEAAQRYGIFIRDTASNVAFYAQDPIPTGTNPYTGSHGYFEGKSPGQLLASFPWSHLQLLKMELHSAL
jgi:hypothetical protein